MTEAENPSPSLEDLMHRAQQGDKKAYEALFHAILPMLKAFVSRRLSGTADVEDVVQDILLSIHCATHTYDKDRSFKVWMFAIARYRLNDHLRRMYSKERNLEISLEDMTDEISASDVTESRDRHEYLNNILVSLPEKQRKIVTMMKVEGYTAADTARAMNMSVSAVKVAAHRAYKSLELKVKAEQEAE